MVLSYHGDPAIKAAHIAQAERHYAADMLAAGTYGDEADGKFRGCSVGCFAHEIDPASDAYHAVVAKAAGWPEWLVHLSDKLFEGLPDGERDDFHVDLRKRVPVGVELTPVLHAIAVDRMDRLLAIKEVQEDSAVAAAVAQVCALHATKAAAKSAAESAAESAAWSAAKSAAWSAAKSAAESAAWSAAKSAAKSAAWSAAKSAAKSAAESAAWSAAWSAAKSAAKSAAWSAAKSAAWSAAKSAAWSAAWSAAKSAAWSAAYRAERDSLYAALARVSHAEAL